MKKYLLIGLAILISANVVVLGGVAYNRLAGQPVQLTLTERELSLPYRSGRQKESSGVSLSFNWRAPTGKDETYYPYNSRDIKITKSELIALGFSQTELKKDYMVESRELYWAFEFDGSLHKAEIKKAENKYQAALSAYEEQPNESNSYSKTKYEVNLEREKTTNSRLFFIEASADRESLSKKFEGQRNILIVRGVAKPYYHSNDKTYSLMLKKLSVSHIMIPLEYARIFRSIESRNENDTAPPRFSADIKWGSRLEPWVINVKRLAY